MAATTTVTTSNIRLPKEVAKELVTKTRDNSVIQSLSPVSPYFFRDVDHIMFTQEPEAEFVAEGANHGASYI